MKNNKKLSSLKGIFLLFKEVPTFATFIGGILILISSALVILKGQN